MANQNFKVKNGLEVGTGVTISAGVITATNFSGNFSGNATSSTYASIAGIATYAPNAGISTSVIDGIASVSSLIVSGVSTFQNDVRLGDNDRVVLGDDNDLQIWHSGSDSVIADLGAGNLALLSDNEVWIGNAAASEYIGRFINNGAVELYHDNVKKFETTGYGATVFGTLETQQLNASGISTLGNTVVGGATTELIVNGDARITGILTIGTSSITFDGTNNSVTVGTGVTIFGNTGIISATEFRGNGTNLTTLNASNLGSGTIPDARFPATLPAVSGASLTSLNASNLGSGTIPDARFPAILPAISGANLTGVQPFPSGTLMLFQQTTAPTGWTKQTTHNNKALRVVSGTASSGGSTAFTSVFTSRTPTGSNSGGSVSNTTLSASQLGNHTHNYSAPSSYVSGLFAYGGSNKHPSNILFPSSVGATSGGINGGSGGAHNHGFTNPTFAGNAMDFAVQYVDLIIASKT